MADEHVWADDITVNACETCKGSGKVNAGPTNMLVQCPDCHGTGGKQ